MILLSYLEYFISDRVKITLGITQQLSKMNNGRFLSWEGQIQRFSSLLVEKDVFFHVSQSGKFLRKSLFEAIKAQFLKGIDILYPWIHFW